MPDPLPPESRIDGVTDGGPELESPNFGPTLNAAARTNAVVHGTRWMTLSTTAVQGIRLLVSVVLARLLAPADFGLLAMAFVVISFADIFKDLGTKAALIQKRELTTEFASTVFWLNIGIGAVLATVVMLGAPIFAALYAEPTVVDVLRVMGLVLAISAFGLAQQAHLYRELRFRALAAVQFTVAGVNMVVAISLALAGWGVWALVAGTVSSAAAGILVTWILSDWRPAFAFRWRDLEEIAGFSLNLSGSQILGFALSNGDKILIARFLGASPLGYFNIAHRTLTYPVQSITRVLQQVLFPTMSRIQDDDAAIARGYLRACAGISLLTFPAMVGIAVLARPLVEVVLGERWLPAAPLIAVLAPVGAVQSLTYTVSVLYQVKGRTDWLLRWSLVSGVAMLSAVWFGLQWGILGVVVAFAVVIAALTYPAFAIPFRLIGLRFRALAVVVRPYTLASLTMGAAVLLLRVILNGAGASPLTVVSLGVPLGVAIYGAFLQLWRPPALDDLLRLVLPSRRAP